VHWLLRWGLPTPMEDRVINFLFAWFFALFVYGCVIGNAGVGVLALFCGACLYYFDKKLAERTAAYLKSPAAAKAPPDTKQMLDKHACETSCKICQPRF
jgi:hypothetical protein